jgi:hypothetical protein
MVWPYVPFSEVFEHAAACAVDAATSVRQATAAANVPLQNVRLQNMPLQKQVFIFLSPQKIDRLGPKTSVVPFERQIAGTRQDWQWRTPDGSLIFS